MKAIVALFSIGLLLLSSVLPGSLAQTYERCREMRVRRSAHSLSPGDWGRIKRVLDQMHQDGHIERFAESHVHVFSQVHGTSMFFPFHRRFVIEFENIARTYDPEFTVPYWDSTIDYRSPANSPILQDVSLGTNGVGANHCLTTGVQGNWNVKYPTNHCLKRDFDRNGNIRSWYAPEIISSYVQSDTTLAKFREDIEYTIHGAVHLGLGGDASTPYAPLDFFFMAHHANIDRLWWIWQNSHGFFNYNGNGTSGPATLNDRIPNAEVSFGSESVDSVMVLGYGPVCYTYEGTPSIPEVYPARSGAIPAPGRVRMPNKQEHREGIVAVPKSGLIDENSAQGFVSGSSDLANTIIEADGIRNALDRESIGQFFPGVLPVLKERKRQAGAVSESELIPLPPPIAGSWIEMHGFDPERVQAVYERACRLVETLNRSNYNSPW